MLKFDFSEVLTERELNSGLNDILSLMTLLETRTSEYVNNVKDLTNGLTPEEGSSLASPNQTLAKDFVSNELTELSKEQLASLVDVYHKQTYQLLCALGCIPLGRVAQDSTTSFAVSSQLEKVWNSITFEDSLIETACLAIYPHISGFGLLERRVEGHSGSDFCYFLTYNNQTDYSYLTNWIAQSASTLLTSNIILLSETEYDSKLVAENGLTFLFRFSRMVSQYQTDMTFVLNTKLKKHIPTYLLDVSCDTSGVLQDFPNLKYNLRPHNSRLIEFLQGETINIPIVIPANTKIGFISMDEKCYFVDSEEFAMTGITITKNNTTEDFSKYDIWISGLLHNCKLFIGICEDFTGKTPVSDKISTRSSIIVSEDDVQLNLLFKNPFIWFNAKKMHIYARKEDGAVAEEITNFSILESGQNYTTRTLKLGPVYHPTCNVMDNPIEPVAIVYHVMECGVISITIPGYINYKYFWVEFEPYAMISSYLIPGTFYPKNIVPNIEKKSFVNTTVENTPTVETPESGEANTTETTETTTS